MEFLSTFIDLIRTYMKLGFKGAPDFMLQVFFHDLSSPKSLKITLGSFQIFHKFAEFVSTTPVVHLELRIFPPIKKKI